MGPTAALPDPRPLQCMEIRGGSQVVDEAVSTPGLDAWVHSRPFEGAANGGDVYYLSLCGGGVITRLIVADVSGHGEEVADVSDSLRTLMRAAINTKSQTRLVGRLNRRFADLMQLRRFATAIVATYLATSRTLTVCNAGHPRPLLYRAEAGSWEVLEGDVGTVGNLPLGLDEESPYHQFSVPLGRGDVVLVYTDALTEAMDPSGTLLGEPGLLELVAGLDPADPRRLGSDLLAAVGRHRGGRPAADDETLVAIRQNGGGPRRLTLAQKVDVYAKVFRLKKY